MRASTTSVWRQLADTHPGRQHTDRRGIWDALREHLNLALYRPVRSSEVAAVPLTSRSGQPYYILANRPHSKYLQLTPEDHHLWTLMDGMHSIKDLIFEYFTHFGSLAFDRVAQLVMHLRRDRMLADQPRDLFAAVRRALRRGSGQSVLRVFREILFGQRSFRIRQVDKLIGRLHRQVGWLFYTTPMQILYVGVSVVGGWLFIQHLTSGRYDLFQANGSYTQGLLLLAVLNYFSITVHEMSHAMTCKHYGAHVNSAGVMLFYGMPAYFVDTSDIWTKPMHARIATTWAGPYSGVILAGVCAIVVQVIPASPVAPILHRLSFLWILTLLFNLIPLLELDGYFILIDWLETPMLRPRALTFARKELWGKLRRREPLAGQDRLLAWFGVVSLAFSIFVVILALLSWQYRLRSLTQTLWGGGVGSKALMILLLLVLSLPMALSLGGRALSASRAAGTWTRTRWHQPRRRALEHRETLLREVHFLSPLSEEELSQVATRMKRKAFGPSEVIIRRGEAGDRFYIIERGTAEVLVGEETVPRRNLGRGDYFGEIALLERIDRTATVRAASPLSVLWLGRGDFDRLVASHVSASAQINETIHTMEKLRGFPILSDLSSRELDALASRLLRERFSPGAVVIQEGERGDSFYLVESGQAEVIVGGRRQSILGRGNYFGEIALLLDVPRTATVRALTPLGVLRLNRADFEALVITTLHRVAAVLEDVGRGRLASTGSSGITGNGEG
jgi:CRP-like cAMP-binding protein/Zn-dependent protease